MTMHKVITYSVPKFGGKNEDVLYVRPHSSLTGLTCAVLADGQGGRPGGAHAAQTAVDCAIRYTEGAAESVLKKQAFWSDAVVASDRAVADDLGAGYTTLLAFAVNGNAVVGASNGDCDAYLLAPNVPPLRLTSGQPKNPPVGSGATACLPFTAKLPAKWMVALMSDGVSKYVDEGTLFSLIGSRTGEALIKAIESVAMERGGGALRDDLSFALITGT